jgi:ABC-2 type transport system ATP-binding protein
LADEGLTILWATHLTDEVADTDRLVLLHRGRLLADTTAAAFRGDRSLSDAFLTATHEDA